MIPQSPDIRKKSPISPQTAFFAGTYIKGRYTLYSGILHSRNSHPAQTTFNILLLVHTKEPWYQKKRALYLRQKRFIMGQNATERATQHKQHLTSCYYYVASQIVLNRFPVGWLQVVGKITRLFCRISSLLQGSFAKETYNFKEPKNRSHPRTIHLSDNFWDHVSLKWDHVSLKWDHGPLKWDHVSLKWEWHTTWPTPINVSCYQMCQKRQIVLN